VSNKCIFIRNNEARLTLATGVTLPAYRRNHPARHLKQVASMVSITKSERRRNRKGNTGPVCQRKIRMPGMVGPSAGQL
jgi:hypothetical protein